MYAVIRSGGKQYKLAKGDIFSIEKIDSDVGSSIDLTEVLMVANGEKLVLGDPYVTGAKITASVCEQRRDTKVKILKFHRRKHHRKQMGHRQYLTRLKVTDIVCQ